jgi:hypothetical protein
MRTHIYVRYKLSEASPFRKKVASWVSQNSFLSVTEVDSRLLNDAAPLLRRITLQRRGKNKKCKLSSKRIERQACASYYSVSSSHSSSSFDSVSSFQSSDSSIMIFHHLLISSKARVESTSIKLSEGVIRVENKDL